VFVKLVIRNVFLLAMMLVASMAIAQDQKAAETDEAKPYVPQYSDAEWVEYEFGVKIECSGGYALTTTAVAPIPMIWPEQEIEWYEETKSNNIKKIVTKDLKKGASIMWISVPRLNNGDYAEAILRYRIRRRSTLRPDDTDQFSIARKLTGKLKKHLRPSPFIESKDKRIRQIGEEIFADTEDLSDWEKVEAVYSWVRENIRYKFDTQLHSCIEALDKGHGDCEELSSLFIAICRSQGIPARAVWIPGHTYPEFYLVDATGKGHWFPCQAAGQNHEFGEMLEERPIMQKGDKFKGTVGDKKEKRYVEPALESKHGTGALSFEHIMRKVSNE